MGELFAHRRIRDLQMDRVPLDQSESERFILERGDLLFARQSLVLEGAGKCSIFLGDRERVTFESHVTRVRLNPEEADPEFYFYYLQSPVGRSVIGSIVEQGAGVAGIRASDLAALEVIWRPVSNQRAIADILRALDDKIDLNQRLNETLEAMARALFESWFVDFDPVLAKAEGRDPGLPQPIADLFPDGLEDSDAGLIPRGWRSEPFSEGVGIIGGGTPATSVADYWGGNVPWFSVVDAPRTSDVWVIETERNITESGLENSSASLLPVGTTIVTARGTVGRVALVAMPMAMNQSCYGLRSKGAARGYFTYFRTRELLSILQQRAHGSVFETITRSTLDGVSVVAPPEYVVRAFEDRVHPLLERIRTGLIESRALGSVRDVLVPRLVSGEIRVPQAERMPEAAPV